MALTVIDAIQQRGQTVSANSTLYIMAAGAVLENAQDLGVICDDGARVTNLGVIMAETFAVSDGGAQTTDQNIRNAGIIHSTASVAIRFQDTLQQNLTLLNTGEISTTGNARGAIVLSAGGNAITNHGTISAAYGVAIDISTGTQGAGNTIVNTGTISTGRSRGNALDLDGAADHVFNTGTIVGHVVLRGGADIYDGRGGQVTGWVYGGDGHDLYKLGDASTTLIELAGGGIDTVEVAGDYALGANIERLWLLGAGLIGIGNDRDNRINGNGRDNALYGGLGADTLRGSGGDDVLRGGDGEDALIGGGWMDVMYGGAGDDRFVFNSAFDSLSSGNDTLASFRKGSDDIDLRDLDGNTDVARMQNFTFLGTAAFTGAGQVRIVDDGPDVRVEINLDSDGGAEMEIVVADVSTLTAGDFLL